MKLNKFFLFAAAAMATVFSACSSEDNITVGEQDSDKPFVYLSDDNQLTWNLEPTETTELTFTVCRRDSTSAAEIPMEVTDTAGVFTCPNKVSFAAGAATATVTASFPNAKIGTPYALRVSFTSDYAGIYKTGTREQEFVVTRVKWNSLGEGNLAENFWWEESEFNCEILQRDDKPTQFRIVKPFGAYEGQHYSDGSDVLNGRQSEYIDITILQPKDQVYDATITKKDLVYFTTVNTGYYYASYGADVKMYHPAAFTSYCDEAYFTYNKVLSWQDGNEIPGQIQLAPFYYMDGVGGWNETQQDGMVIITFPGFIPQYEADIETDFDFSEEFSGELQSGLLGTTSNASLYVGTCTTTKDDCDKRFEEEHGKLYKLASPYAEDYNLTFYIKKGVVALPDGAEYEAQPTGMTALGKDVYAHINAGNSSYEDGILTLNITFTDEDGEVDYGTYDEILQNVKWNSLGMGLWTDAFVGPLFGADAVTYSVEVLECENKPGLYRVMNAYSNSTYPYADDDCAPDGSYVTVDATDPDGVFIEKQDLGFDWGYGETYLESVGAYYLSYGYTADQLKQYGYLGTLKDGVITLPYLKLSDSYSGTAYVYLGTSGYYGDTDNQFKLVLPSAVTSSAKAKAKAKAKAAKRSFTKKFVGKKANIKAYKFAVRKSGKAAVLKSYIKTAPKLTVVPNKVAAPAF